MEIVTLAVSDGTYHHHVRVNRGVITGGGGGLGKALLETFSTPEWEVIAPDHATLDVSDSKAIWSWFNSRSVDLLICAAGIIRDVPILRMHEEDWNKVIAVDYQGAADAAAAVLPGMISRGRGHIVFISSHSALHPPVGQAAYATAKAALLGLTVSLARQHGPNGIRVNAILPGFLETQMTKMVSTPRKARILADHALGHFNTPAAAAKFIRYLHEHLTNTSGQIFQLDSRTF